MYDGWMMDGWWLDDGWMDGWMDDGWMMVGWMMVGWMDGWWLDDGWMDGWWLDGWWMDGWWLDDGWMDDGWMDDGWMMVGWMMVGWWLDGWWMDDGWMMDGWWLDDGWIPVPPPLLCDVSRRNVSLGVSECRLQRFSLSDPVWFPTQQLPSSSTLLLFIEPVETHYNEQDSQLSLPLSLSLWSKNTKDERKNCGNYRKYVNECVECVGEVTWNSVLVSQPGSPKWHMNHFSWLTS